MLGSKSCDMAHLHPDKEDQKGFILEIEGMTRFGRAGLGLCKLVKEPIYQFDIVGETWFCHLSPPCEMD